MRISGGNPQVELFSVFFFPAGCWSVSHAPYISVSVSHYLANSPVATCYITFAPGHMHAYIHTHTHMQALDVRFGSLFENFSVIFLFFFFSPAFGPPTITVHVSICQPRWRAFICPLAAGELEARRLIWKRQN